MTQDTPATLKPLLRAILSILVASALLGCNPFHLKWSHTSPDTVVDRLKVECAESGGEWTSVGCDPELPWR